MYNLSVNKGLCFFLRALNDRLPNIVFTKYIFIHKDEAERRIWPGKGPTFIYKNTLALLNGLIGQLTGKGHGMAYGWKRFSFFCLRRAMPSWAQLLLIFVNFCLFLIPSIVMGQAITACMSLTLLSGCFAKGLTLAKSNPSKTSLICLLAMPSLGGGVETPSPSLSIRP